MYTLPRKIVNQILEQSQYHEEDEVCGLIGAKQGLACSFYAIKNAAHDTHHLFRMDPKEQIDAMRQMRDNGEDLFAIYHSHPHSPAEPSATDLAQANYPDALYLIVSLNTKGVLEMQGYKLQNNAVEKQELEVE